MRIHRGFSGIKPADRPATEPKEATPAAETSPEPPAPADRPPAPAPTLADLPPAARALLDEALGLGLIAPAGLQRFLQENADYLAEYTSAEALGSACVEAGVLTAYQLDRLLAGTTHGLVLGNYRVLDRMGGGSICVVFLGEHFLMKRRVAIKVVPVDDNFPPALLERFYAEMRVLADLHHPNIVLAYDAGRLPPPGPDLPALHYLVMEYVAGGDLERHGNENGPLSIAQACDWVRQAACGLQEAHDHHLIHRDVKPSNLLLTPDGRVKVVDFGLARQFTSNLTEPNSLLGSIEFMSPEQSRDPTAVSAQADIYGLGATLFWLLTGELPYPPKRTIAEALRALQHERPRRLRTLRPEAPPELESLIDRMLDRDPSQRPAMPVAVMNALHRFAAPAAPAWEIDDFAARAEAAGAAPSEAAPLDQTWRVLIVEGDSAGRELTRTSLEALGCLCEEESEPERALIALQEEPYAMLLLDLDLPGADGYALCRRLRESPPRPHLKILALSAEADHGRMTEAILSGADDFLRKPFDARHLAAKVQHTLRLKDAQDRADLMARHLLLANRQLEHSLRARSQDVRQAHNALLFALAKAAEALEGESVGHHRRLQRYVRRLAEQVADDPAWAEVVNAPFLDQLERCVPLHDIGKIGLPDQVLAKAGPLDTAERKLVESHPLIGAGIVDAIAREYGDSLAFLGMAMVVVRYHHERYDGTGYPDQLAGEVIPAAARLMAVADTYDVVRRRRWHKPGPVPRGGGPPHPRRVGWPLRPRPPGGVRRLPRRPRADSSGHSQLIGRT
jgi:response regulator RpfG family c-di-GMP phosphodiesterase